MDEAIAAVAVGTRDNGVSAMHDATEGGLWGGVYELASAANMGADIYFNEIPILPEVKAVCGLFEIDPYKSISEGTLIATVRPHKADEVLRVIRDTGVDAAIVGEIVAGDAITIHKGDSSYDLAPPKTDPFWESFYNALKMQTSERG